MPHGHPASNLVAKQPKQVSLALTDSNHRLLENPYQLGLEKSIDRTCDRHQHWYAVDLAGELRLNAGIDHPNHDRLAAWGGEAKTNRGHPSNGE